MLIPKRLKKYLYCFILASIFIIFLLLAKWQINRAHQKEYLYEQKTSKLKLTPVEINAYSHIDPKNDRFLPVLLNGHYLADYNFLLDNQQQDGKIGYRLLTPFRINNTNRIILVNRSWVPRGLKRTELPEITTPSNELQLIGHINSPSTGILLGVNIENNSWPLIIQNIDFELISAKVGDKVENYIVQLTPIDYINIGSSKHWGYAVQWMALATMVLTYIIFMVVKWN